MNYHMFEKKTGKFCLSVAILKARLHNLFMYVNFLKVQYI